MLPLVSLLFGNLNLVQPAAVIWPAVVAVSVTVVFWLILTAVVSNRRGAALAVTALTLAAFNHLAVVHVAALLPGRGTLLLIYAFALYVAVSMLRAGERTPALTKHANEILVLALVLLTLAIGREEWRRPAIVVPAAETVHRSGDRPDVYVLILDGYGRADVLRDQFGFDNGLVPALRSRGFFVADQAASNYPQTTHSLASSLNVSYLPALMEAQNTATHDRRSLAGLITDNRVFSLFAAAGYNIRAYSSEYHLVRPGGAAERPAPVGYLTDFGYAAYEATVIPALFELAGASRGWIPLRMHRRHVRWTLNDLAARASEAHQQPQLVFAHVLAPHPPFAFKADGTDRHTTLAALFNDGDHWEALARGTTETYRSGYVDTITFLNARILAIVGSVLSKATRPTIFYIQGDHGPGSRLKWSSAEASDVRERHGIMLAMRFPDGKQPALGQRTTPINAFRVLVNRALGTALPPVDDRSYFATWERPFEFIDVTDRVHAAD